MAEKITPRATDYSQWYIDVVINAKLADYAPVKGCMVIRPRGYALWERIQQGLDGLFKATGHVNAYFPLLIPESFIRKEAQHVEGFSPELAVVTQAAGKSSKSRSSSGPRRRRSSGPCTRNGSSPIATCRFSSTSGATSSGGRSARGSFSAPPSSSGRRDTRHTPPRPRLRRRRCAWSASIRPSPSSSWRCPFCTGVKTDSEKFAGAVRTYCIEAMMQDRKALQAGTSHNLGQNFGKAFDVTFQTREKTSTSSWDTSWGASTRLIGAVIMAHSDDKGLVLPPRLAPIEVVIVPIFKNDTKETVLAFARKLRDSLAAAFRVTLDEDDQNTPGWKFSEYEVQGIPVRVEIGPRDIEKGQFVAVRRDTGEKAFVPVAEAGEKLRALLNTIQESLYQRALKFRMDNTFRVADYGAFKTKLDDPGGFIEAGWCGDPACEAKVKEETKATIRLLPMEKLETAGASCIVCGKTAQVIAVFGRAY